jgi:hypothetical protein
MAKWHPNVLHPNFHSHLVVCDDRILSDYFNNEKNKDINHTVLQLGHTQNYVSGDSEVQL